MLTLKKDYMVSRGYNLYLSEEDAQKDLDTLMGMI